MIIAYTLLVILTLALEVLRLWSIVWTGLKASRQLSYDLTARVLSCDVRIFDETPLGRFLTRFTSDLWACDVSD